MAIETTAVTIADLNPEYPLPDDYISEGDDHIKLIKKTLQNTFTKVDEPLTVEISFLNDLNDYMDLTTVNSGGVNLKEIALQGVKVTGALNATNSTDLVPYGQLQNLITAALSQRIYRVGSYYFSDDTANPATALGFGSWVKVSGFIAGSGTVTSPGLPDRVLTVKQVGGKHGVKLTAANIPDISTNLQDQGVSTALGGGHIHTVDAVRETSGDGHSVGQGDQHLVQEHIQTSSAPDHSHTLMGTLHLGNADPAVVDLMPPFTVTNVWKRIS